MIKNLFLFLALAICSVSFAQTGNKIKPSVILDKSGDKNNKANVSFFEGGEDYNGFDEWQFPCWSSVRHLSKHEFLAISGKSYAKNLAFVSSNPTVARMSGTKNAVLADGILGEEETAYSLGVVGNAVGNASIYAKVPEIGTVEQLDVSVKPKRVIICDFYFLKDKGGAGHGPSAQKENVDAMISQINEVWQKQANIVIKRGIVKDVVFQEDMGEFFDSNDVGKVENKILASYQSKAERKFVLTWKQKIATGKEDIHPLGFNFPGSDFVYSGVYGEFTNRRVIPHELGHSLDLGHQPRDVTKASPMTNEEITKYGDMVMFPTAINPLRLRREEIDYVN